ncbi:MAG: aldo/keto reductase [Candidatus Anammoxibacter sp.]
MLYRRFGRTELQMPVFTYGSMRLHHSWKRSDVPTKESLKNVETAVHRSLELGINHIDTANGYGTSEEELGYALKGVPRDSYYLQSKVPLREDGTLFSKMFEESMKALCVDYLDLFSLHGINNKKLLDIALRKNGCLDIALKLKKEGRIKHIGFSTHGPTDIIVDAIRSGAFDYVNLHWFYIFQDNWPAILEAKKQDMGVLIISPNDKGGMLYKPSDKLRNLTKPLSPMMFNDLFCLSRPEVHTLTIGVSHPDDFNEHLKAIELYDERDTLIPPIVKNLEDEFCNTLGDDWASSWKQGLPKWHETPGNINIPTILFLWNLVRAYDLIEYGKMRFNLMGNADHWFPGNRPENLDSYDFSECLTKSPHADRIPEMLKEAYALLSGKEVKRLGER